MAPRRGTEQNLLQLHVVVMIVLEVTLIANPAIQTPAQVWSNVIVANPLTFNCIFDYPSQLYLEFMERMGNLLCKLW